MAIAWCKMFINWGKGCIICCNWLFLSKLIVN